MTGGANNLLKNCPVLVSASTSADSTTVRGTLNSNANISYRIEFFSNSVCDGSGNGEGKTFLGSTNVTTNASGDALIIHQCNCSGRDRRIYYINCNSPRWKRQSD